MARQPATVTIDVERCKGCVLCVDVCPPRVLVMTEHEVNHMGYRYPLLLDGCTGCELCFRICPDFCFEVYRGADGGGGVMSERRVLMEGSHAIAEAAIQAGCRFYAGYPITPSTEILEYMSFRQPQVGGVCVNAESEIEAINMVWGAAGCGVRAMIASTGQGISLMQETLAELSNAADPVRGGQHDARAERLLSRRRAAAATATTATSCWRRTRCRRPSISSALAFYLGDKWRTPVDLLGDFVLAHTSEAGRVPAARRERPAAEDVGRHRRRGPARRTT